MAKECPLTGDVVLYLDCIECDDKNKCRGGQVNVQPPLANQMEDFNEQQTGKKQE